MRRPNLHRQRGNALVAAVIALLLFHIVGYVLMDMKRNVKEKHYYEAEGMGLRQMQSALTQYARANQANFKNGQTVMYVNNQYAPTPTELRSLGFLSQTGPDVMTPWGLTFATTLSLQGNGAIVGEVYLVGSIVDQYGNPDVQHACSIAKAMAPTGICTPPNNASVLGNVTKQVSNPSGALASVGALVSIAP